MDNTRMSLLPGVARSFEADQAPDAYPVPAAVDLRILLKKLWHFRGRIVSVTALFVVLGLLYVSWLGPSYTASARLLIGEIATSTDTGDSEQDATIDAQRLATAVEIFYSTRILRGVAAELLQSDDIRWAESDGVLSFDRNVASENVTAEEATTSDGRIDETTQNAGEIEYRINSLVAHLAEGLFVHVISDSSIISVSFTSNDPALSMRVANLVADRYISERRRASSEETARQLAWLRERIEGLREEILSTEDDVEARRAELSLEAKQGLEISRSMLATRADELADAQSEVARLELISKHLSAALGDERDIMTNAEFREAPLLRQIMAQVRELEERIRTLPETSSARSALEKELQNKHADIRREAEHIAVGIRQDLEAARGREASLSEVVRKLENRVLTMTRAWLDLRQLEMDVDIRRRNYEELNRQYLNTVGRAERRPLGAQILSRADLLYSNSRRHIFIVALSTFTGFLLVCGSLIFRDVFTDTFRSVGALKSFTGRPVLGRIPRVHGSQPHQVLTDFVGSRRSALAEAVRCLALNFLHTASGSAKVIMFTSSLGDEGKSTLALMTAIQLHRFGEKTLFLDCELANPAFHTLLTNNRASGGLNSVLKKGRALRDAIVVDPATKLSLVSLHSEDGSEDVPVDELQSAEFRDLIDELRNEYRHIVMNVQPTLIATDAKCLARVADIILMVVRWNHTRRNALMDSLAELQSVGVQPTGLVMNVVDESEAIPYEPGGYQYYRAKAKRFDPAP